MSNPKITNDHILQSKEFFMREMGEEFPKQEKEMSEIKEGDWLELTRHPHRMYRVAHVSENGDIQPYGVHEIPKDKIKEEISKHIPYNATIVLKKNERQEENNMDDQGFLDEIEKLEYETEELLEISDPKQKDYIDGVLQGLSSAKIIFKSFTDNNGE